MFEKACVTQMYHRRGFGAGAPSHRRLWGCGGQASSRWKSFCNFLKKKAILMPLDHISNSSEPFESTRFLTFEGQLKKSNCLILLLLAI